MAALWSESEVSKTGFPKLYVCHAWNVSNDLCSATIQQKEKWKQVFTATICVRNVQYLSTLLPAYSNRISNRSLSLSLLSAMQRKRPPTTAAAGKKGLFLQCADNEKREKLTF
jgi:hypothetical protein